jgi:hypothetical protein
MIIKNTGKHPRDLADGGRVGYSKGKLVLTGLTKGFQSLFGKGDDVVDLAKQEEIFRSGDITTEFLEKVDPKVTEKFIRSRDTMGPGGYGMYDNFDDMPNGLKAAELISRIRSTDGGINYEAAEMFIGKKLKGNETVNELISMVITDKKADGGRVGLRYGGDTMGGPNDRSQNTASDTGPGGGATDTGPSFTGDSIGGGDVQDLGFIGSGPTVNPNLGTKGPTLVGPGPTGDGPGPGYVMSTTPTPSLLDKAITTGRNIFNNPIARTLGLGAITAINPALGGKLRRGMMFKGMLDSALAESGSVLEDMTTGTDVTGQTTALYKDGGLASMFVEKR